MASTAPPNAGVLTRSSAAPIRARASGMRALPWQAMEAPQARAGWDTLARAASEPNPFFESWYLLPSLRALNPAGGVQLLRFQHDGTLAGILPIVRSPRYYRWPIPHLSSWVHANCFLGAPLVAAGCEREFWRATLGWADRHARTGLFLHLGHMPLTGPLHDALVAVLTEGDRTAALVHKEDRALLSTALSPGDYFGSALSGKKRKELRRQFNRLAELGEVAFTRQLDGEGLAEWCSVFLALETSGWKGAAGSALGSHHATAALFREAMEGAAIRGKLERLTLSLDGEPLAMLATFLTPPGAYSYKTAFDERFARFSPGVLLQRENLAVLDRPEIRWTDSCAGADHPMIDHLWRERRPIGRLSIAIGGKLRRALFGRLARAELGRNPTGLAA